MLQADTAVLADLTYSSPQHKTAQMTAREPAAYPDVCHAKTLQCPGSVSAALQLARYPSATYCLPGGLGVPPEPPASPWGHPCVSGAEPSPRGVTFLALACLSVVVVTSFV